MRICFRTIGLGFEKGKATGIKVPNNLTFLSVKERRSLSLGIIGKTRNEQKTLTVSCPVKQYSRVALSDITIPGDDSTEGTVKLFGNSPGFPIKRRSTLSLSLSLCPCLCAYVYVWYVCSSSSRIRSTQLTTRLTLHKSLPILIGSNLITFQCPKRLVLFLKNIRKYKADIISRENSKIQRVIVGIDIFYSRYIPIYISIYVQKRTCVGACVRV